MPDVSVIVVNFNTGDLLSCCLHSIFSESPQRSFEVIVVDNASSDGSADAVEEAFPGVRLICSGRNLGFAGGVCRAAQEAEGSVLVLLNPDAEILPGCVDALAETLSRPDVAIAGCKIFDPDGQTLQHAGAVLHPNLITSHRGRGEADQGQYNDLVDSDYVTGAALAVTRSLWDLLGGLDPGYRPGYYEETELCLRAKRRGYRVVYVPEARVIHHESASSGKLSRRFFYAYHRNRLRFLVRNFSPLHWAMRFAPAEVRWMLAGCPAEQRVPLLRAYAANLLRFPLTLVGR